MATEAFVTFVHVHVVPGAEETFLEASRMNASHSRQEEGCTRFEVVQQIQDPTTFILIDGWVGEEAVTAHRATAHYAAWREAVDGLMAEERHAERFVSR